MRLRHRRGRVRLSMLLWLGSEVRTLYETVTRTALGARRWGVSLQFF